jgi:hypothetical protein
MDNGACQRFHANDPGMENQHAQRDETTTPHAFHSPFSILHSSLLLARPRWPGIFLLLAAILLACAIWWAFIITPWAAAQTQTTHAIWRANVPGLDLGLDAHAPVLPKCLPLRDG